MRFISCCLALLLLSTAVGHSETPEEGVVRLEQKWNVSDAGNSGFEKEYWLFARQIAQQHGTAVIAPVMERSKKWRSEEGLIYVPLIALLPRAETIKILKQYQSSENEKMRIWAKEFLMEFEMSDTQKAVERFRSR